MAGILWREEDVGPVKRVRLSRRVGPWELRQVSFYHWDGILVDTGVSLAEEAFAAFLDDHRVEAVLTTHHHEDHIGNHHLLQGVPVYAPPLTAEVLMGTGPRVPAYRRFAWGQPPPREGLDLHVVTGETLEVAGRTFRVVPTPGHAPDHVAYIEEGTGTCFSGDVYTSRVRLARPVENVPQWMASLERLAAADPDVLLPGHGPVVRDPQGAIEAVVGSLRKLQKEARTLSEAGWSVARIRRELLGREPFLRWFSLGEFRGDHLVRSLLEDDPDATPWTPA